ncbi:MAG: hypothetical protein HOO96_02750 [Polyangiaceae bacterium]|nr:hypothetical protein [Polyangiaceae bacterium]
MMRASVMLRASKVDLIIDDDEGLTSFYASSARPRGHLALTRSGADGHLHCELDDQGNGFRSRTLTYRLDQRTVVFTVRAPEGFDRARLVREVEVLLPPRANLEKVRACLLALFAPG